MNTVAQAQDVLIDRGWNPHQHLVRDHQRHLWSPMGSCVASQTEEGSRLDAVGHVSVQPRRLSASKVSLVEHHLENVDLEERPGLAGEPS